MAGFRKAERKQAKLRLGLVGPSGSGKTMSALLVAYGLCENWDDIGIVDTESGSAELYVGSQVGDVTIGQYNVLAMSPPYEIQKYTAAIKEAEQAGLKVIILDSISHAWAGDGGLLDQKDKITRSSKSGNSYTAWRDVTPLHNKFIDTMLQSSIHVIATMRAKTEYVQEKGDKGQTIIRKVGMAPVQREGMDYEFTVVFDISHEHIASSSKDRTNLFDNKYFTPSPDTGRQLLAWLETGADPDADRKKKGLAALHAKAAETGLTHDDIKEIAAQKYSVGSLTELSLLQLQALYKDLHAKEAANA